MMTLDMARPGDTIRILRITEPETATMAMRLGIAEGETLELASRIPGGPVVVRRGKMEIALGRELCKGIEISKV